MAFICLANCIYPILRKKNINNKNKLGVLKGAGVESLLRLVLNTVSKVLPTLLAEYASFQIGILSVNGKVLVSVTTKLNALTRSFVHSVVQDTDVSWLCPL